MATTPDDRGFIEPTPLPSARTLDAWDDMSPLEREAFTRGVWQRVWMETDPDSEALSGRETDEQRRRRRDFMYRAEPAQRFDLTWLAGISQAYYSIEGEWRAHIVRCHRADCSSREIAAHAGISHTRVLQILAEEGERRRSPLE